VHNHNVSRHFPFRSAWVILFVMSLLLMTVSLSYHIFAHRLDPQAHVMVQQLSQLSPPLGNCVRELLRVFGLSWLTWGFLSAVVAVTAYRRGEMWARGRGERSFRDPSAATQRALSLGRYSHSEREKFRSHPLTLCASMR
jgi:hypothetical protein